MLSTALPRRAPLPLVTLIAACTLAACGEGAAPAPAVVAPVVTPPAQQPPTTNPPTTTPPTTTPPTATPPAADPPAAQPPADTVPVTPPTQQPPTTTPPTTTPPTATPPAADPPATQPPADTVPVTPPINRHPHAERIEPLDTQASTTSASAAKQHRVRSAWPAGMDTAHIALPAPSAQQIQTLKNANHNNTTRALQVGFARAVSQTAQGVSEQLKWATLSDGTQVAALTFSSASARGVRVAAVVHELPAGAVLRFWSQSQSDAALELSTQEIQIAQQRQAAAGLTGDAARTVYSPFVDGERVTLEVHLPAVASPQAVRLAVPRLEHLAHSVTDVATKQLAAIGAAGACHVDSMCRATEQQRRAVVKFLYKDDGDGGVYACSGTLVNNTADDRKPYFLTAAHCVDSGTEAASMEGYWFFHSAACGQPSTVNPRYQVITGGAQWLYSKGELDFTFVQFNAAAPEGAFFSGLYTGTNPNGTTMEGIHHPGGDLQKYSAGRVVWADPTKRFLHVQWNDGVTEVGSSGSGLLRTFDGQRYLVGVLHAGNASCENLSGVDMYGRLDTAYHDKDNSTVRDKLRPR